MKEHLERGDCYQVNLTARSQYHFQGSAPALYQFLKGRQPADFCAYIRTPHRQILSFSPELFFKIQRQGADHFLLETRPVKGTAPRGKNDDEDERLRRSLRNDEKTRAENIMIVDLLRNDLGKLALPGSVRTTELLATETLPTLHQMHSTIQGDFTEGQNKRLFREIMPALFPCGSITGAPKSEVRKIIRRLEDSPRGVYTGTIGYASPDKAVFNVAIRTLEIDNDNGEAVFGSGCGIVWDSDPLMEWEEYNLKKAFLKPALSSFRLIETMLFKNASFPFLRGIPFDRRRIFAILRGLSPGKRPLRVRLTVDNLGEARMESFPLESNPRTPGRLLLSPERVFSGDPFRKHKTSVRLSYDSEYQRARKLGYADIIFLNERDEIVESATSNLLLLDFEGRWRTPSPECGALPGVCLEHLKRHSRKGIREAKLKIDDLKQARGLFLCNSVRGIRRVLPP